MQYVSENGGQPFHCQVAQLIIKERMKKIAHNKTQKKLPHKRIKTNKQTRIKSQQSQQNKQTRRNQKEEKKQKQQQQSS